MNTRQTKYYNELLYKQNIHTTTPPAPLAFIARIHENSSFPIRYLGLIVSLSPSLYPGKVSIEAVALYGSPCIWVSLEAAVEVIERICL